MDPKAATFPQIPEDWNRESTKTIARQSGARSVQHVDTVSNAVQPAGNTILAPVKKRKRAVPASASTSSVVETTQEIDPIDEIMGSITEETASIEDKNELIHPPPTMGSSMPTQLSGPCTAAQTTPGQSSEKPRRHCDETESVMRGLYHQVEKLARRPGCALEEGIYLDSIMTHIPYVEVLQQMFGGSALTDSSCVPVVTRAYEESYMREVLSGVDEPCIMGTNCECQFIDEHNPFTGVQFTLPVEAFSSAAKVAGMVEELSSNKLCVLCCRKHTQSLFYEALYNHRAYSACIQLYGNICDIPGEYAKEAMLICPLSRPINNMPLPVVAHQRNRYSVVVHNGVRQLRQHRVAFEDFHAPSSSR
jgi:hypothetical protein